MASALLDLIEKILTEKAEGHVCHILLGPVKNEDENLHVKYQWLTSLESAKFLPQIQV